MSKKKPTLEEAKQVLIEESAKKKQECAKEVQKILNKYGMELTVSPINITITNKK